MRVSQRPLDRDGVRSRRHVMADRQPPAVSGNSLSRLVGLGHKKQMAGNYLLGMAKPSQHFSEFAEPLDGLLNRFERSLGKIVRPPLYVPKRRLELFPLAFSLNTRRLKIAFDLFLQRSERIDARVRAPCCLPSGHGNSPDFKRDCSD